MGSEDLSVTLALLLIPLLGGPGKITDSGLSPKIWNLGPWSMK